VSIFSGYVRQQPPLAGGSSGGIGTNSSIKIIEKTDTYYDSSVASHPINYYNKSIAYRIYKDLTLTYVSAETVRSRRSRGWTIGPTT
jgi:hypothetical protein